MRVLGIDPGSRVMGWGLVEERAGRLVQIAAGITAPHGDLAARLGQVAACVEDLIERWCPETIAIERAFVGKSVASALRLGEARGALYAVAGRRGLSVVDYAPATVKVAVAGSGQAEKGMVARGVQLLLGGTRVAGDEADALAVAICHLRHAAFASRLRPSVEPAPAVRRARTAVPRAAVARTSAGVRVGARD
jgi:crossover junction endodeoxyribonuclease RuvC